MTNRDKQLTAAIEVIINRGPYIKLHSIGDGYCVHGAWHSDGCIKCAEEYLQHALGINQQEKSK